MREHAFVIVLLVTCFGIVGTIDRQVAEAAEKERQKMTREDRARIWSQRCERKGMDVLAKQKDGGKWEIQCIPRRVLKV